MILVKFKNLPPLELAIDNTELGRQYQNLVEENYSNQFPIFRDTARYDLKYMQALADKAKHQLGFDWQSDSYGLDLTASLHKDLEQLLAMGFNGIPEKHDDLIHELHYCLHLIQGNRAYSKRSSWLQIEWYNDSGFDLIGTQTFKKNLNFGEIKLQNPFVGHGPLQIYLEDDFLNVKQTCKFHNFVKPGINISLINSKEINLDDLIDKFKKADPDFVSYHGEKKILDYTGYPVIGRVANIEDLSAVKQYSGFLELESLNFE